MAHRLPTILVQMIVVFLVSQTAAAQVKIRYKSAEAPARVEVVDGTSAEVTFDEPQRAVTPGQGAVVYQGDLVVGGGWIV